MNDIMLNIYISKIFNATIIKDYKEINSEIISSIKTLNSNLSISKKVHEKYKHIEELLYISLIDELNNIVANNRFKSYRYKYSYISIDYFSFLTRIKLIIEKEIAKSFKNEDVDSLNIINGKYCEKNEKYINKVYSTYLKIINIFFEKLNKSSILNSEQKNNIRNEVNKIKNRHILIYNEKKSINEIVASFLPKELINVYKEIYNAEYINSLKKYYILFEKDIYKCSQLYIYSNVISISLSYEFYTKKSNTHKYYKNFNTSEIETKLKTISIYSGLKIDFIDDEIAKIISTAFFINETKKYKILDILNTTSNLEKKVSKEFFNDEYIISNRIKKIIKINL